MPRTLIAPTTSSTIVSIPLSKTYPNSLNPLPATISAFGLGVGETIKIEMGNGLGTWVDYIVNGTQVVLTNANDNFTLYAPVFLRINKPTTASPVDVSISTADNP